MYEYWLVGLAVAQVEGGGLVLKWVQDKALDGTCIYTVPPQTAVGEAPVGVTLRGLHQ